MDEKNLIIAGLICLIIGVIIIVVLNIGTSPIVKIDQPLDISIYFCPKDNCKDVFLSTINNSNKIHCAFYDLEFELPKQAIIIPNNRTYGLMHNKFCILDDRTVITGSMNPTERGTTLNNNNLVIINSEYLAKNYEQEFQELNKGIFGSGSKTKYTQFKFINTTLENYFCPEDKCSEKIIKYLQNAKESIYFMTFSFTHQKIADILVKKHDQGIKIQGIFEKSKQSKYTQLNKLKENNLSITFDNNLATMHHKVFIIDEKTVILGSMNPTNAGDTTNDENILIIQDENIAQKFLEEFNSLT